MTVTDTLAREIEGAVLEAASMLADERAVREVRAKSPTDFVTNVDFAVQEQLRRRLDAIAPGVQFMGEEQDNSRLDAAQAMWILDPVDGTMNLIRGLRRSAVSLALAEGGRVVYGAVYDPYAGELFTARLGGGAYLNGDRIHVTAATELAQALVSVGTAPGKRSEAARVFREMYALYVHCIDVRRSGSAALDLCDVACGRMDAYVERFLYPWDYAAGMLICSEAGGRVTTVEGGSPPLTSPCGVLASNSALHGQILATLEG